MNIYVPKFNFLFVFTIMVLILLQFAEIYSSKQGFVRIRIFKFQILDFLGD